MSIGTLLGFVVLPTMSQCKVENNFQMLAITIIFYIYRYNSKDILFTSCTLEFQIDNTVGKNLHGWKKDIDNGARATEMCPDIKAIGIWLSAIENL